MSINEVKNFRIKHGQVTEDYNTFIKFSYKGVTIGKVSLRVDGWGIKPFDVDNSWHELLKKHGYQKKGLPDELQKVIDIQACEYLKNTEGCDLTWRFLQFSNSNSWCITNKNFKS